MVLARVGGLLLIAGSLALGLWAIAFSGSAVPAGSVVPGAPRSDTLLVSSFALLLGAGAGAVGIAARPPFGVQLTRVSLRLIGVGMLSVGLGRTFVVLPTGGNELQSLPYLILVFGGGLVTVVGSVLCGLSLARSPGVGPRVVGLAILAGPLSLPLAAAISIPLHVDASVIVFIGLWLLILGYAGIGILALGAGGTRPDRSPLEVDLGQ